MSVKWLFSLIWKGEKCNYKHINIPEHVGNGASHFPVSKHVSSLCPSSRKPWTHPNCSLWPILIFSFSRGSPVTRRKCCISSASQEMSGRHRTVLRSSRITVLPFLLHFSVAMFPIPTFTCWEWLIPLAVLPTHQQLAAIQALPRNLTAESEEAVGKNGLVVLWQPFDNHLSVFRWEVARQSWENKKMG